MGITRKKRQQKFFPRSSLERLPLWEATQNPALQNHPKIIQAKIAAQNGIASMDDIIGAALKKLKNHANQKIVRNTRTQKSQGVIGQTDFFKQMITGRRIYDHSGRVKANLERYAQKRGRGYVPTIGEAIEAELERQKQSGNSNLTDAIHNIRFYLASGNQLRAEITEEEMREAQSEKARIKPLKKEHQQTRLKDGTRAALAVKDFIEHHKKTTYGKEPPQRQAIEQGLTNLLNQLNAKQ